MHRTTVAGTGPTPIDDRPIPVGWISSGSCILTCPGKARVPTERPGKPLRKSPACLKAPGYSMSAAVPGLRRSCWPESFLRRASRRWIATRRSWKSWGVGPGSPRFPRGSRAFRETCGRCPFRTTASISSATDTCSISL